MTLSQKISRAVGDYLAAAHISQTALARRINLNQAQFNRRYRNVVPWTLHDIERLIEAGVKIPPLGSESESSAAYTDLSIRLCDATGYAALDDPSALW